MQRRAKMCTYVEGRKETIRRTWVKGVKGVARKGSTAQCGSSAAEEACVDPVWWG
jgi:hypothetical protein